ncbi:hypothetical protein CXB51_006518 [Gossypium anomalum]|uniref:Reverse transcriptase Ty1/copia-type domain-containing protein n=1 Tax=Gossypium anomalum TaxID=47600 RepID=A0A8J5ZXK3_9ROSI|nr:hypothetical protein CXB51_006518 [Gossypium anomalum]
MRSFSPPEPCRVPDTGISSPSQLRMVSPSAPCATQSVLPSNPMSTLRSSTHLASSSSRSVPSSPILVSVLAVPTTNTHAMALTVDKVETEPVSVEKALAHPDWCLAVQAEYDALIANSTWELHPLLPGRKAIGCKWLFKVKTNPDGTVARRKARLVAKGCSQVPGCNFTETFSPVVKPTTIRIILSIAMTNGWPLRQVDVNNALLNGDLTDEVYMQQPPGFVKSGTTGEKLVCRLTKAFYGLRQALRACSSDKINYFVQQLHNEFALKDMGEFHYFLGAEVSRSSSGSLHLSEQKYIQELLARSSMSHTKSVHTPMVSSSVLSKSESEPLADLTEYRSLAVALQYIVLTRPDIVYAVNRVCQFMHAPTTAHMVALKRILRYLRGTLSHGLVFRQSDRLSLVGYADANWGLDFDDRRSTTGYCVYFGHTPVSWCSKKQTVVSRSTAEAEYRSLATASSDITWLTSLLVELHVKSVDLPTMWCDNSSAVAVAAKPVLHSKFKHVELNLFFVREKVASGDLIVVEVPARDQVANILTKPLSVSLFSRFRSLLRVLPLEEAG